MFLALLPLYPVYWWQRAPVKGKNNGLFLCCGIHRPPSVCVSGSLSAHPRSLLFPPSPSAVTEQTGQVINSGATTLNLSCRQGCFSFLLWCDPLCPSHAGISTNKAPQNCDGNSLDPFCVFFFVVVVLMSLLCLDQLVWQWNISWAAIDVWMWC